MIEIKIESKINIVNNGISLYSLFPLYELFYKYDFDNLKFSLFVVWLMILIFSYIFDIFYNKLVIDLKPLKKYVRDCKRLKQYNRQKIYNENPYISVCIPVLNMENFIEFNLLSIINQSLQDFEIIIVNDASTDNIESIIKRIQSDDKRIKLLSHSKSLGVYRSRIESVLNSKSKYILLMDPDDMYLN